MNRLYKFTTGAFEWLVRNIEKNKKLYEDPHADFEKLLSDNFSQYSEPTEITIKGNLDIKPYTKSEKTYLADLQALDFYNSLEGMTPRLATDTKIWAYINHFYLHEYGILRWPSKTKDLPLHVKAHWLTDEKATTKIWKANISGRTWWLAHISIRAAKASNGAFTAEQALEVFTNYPEYFHRSMEFEATRSPTILAECVRLLCAEAKGVNRDGYREILKEINREGGAKLLDSMRQSTIREITCRSADKIMRMPEFVPDRKNLRGVKKYKVLSLGAGTQSTVLALMAESGWENMEKPDIAIFADTQWEPPYVYEHLAWLEKQLSYPVVRVTAGNIRQNILDGVTPDGHNFLDMPVFLINSDGTKSVARRQCTSTLQNKPNP